MSIFFLSPNGDDVWNPASDVARVFHAQVESVADLLGVESGLGAIKSDEIAIETMKFCAFGSALAARIEAYREDSCFVALVGNAFAIALALQDVLGLELQTEAPRIARYRALGHELVGR
jgi:hypothetical protein